ncbi:MAG TPA: phage holin family protein [Prolixibacteraceae bacterium]|nr:phage holin family protein [Prolixibacteraceae bacterium]
MQEKITREMGDLKKEFEDYAKTQIDITKLHLTGEMSRCLSDFLFKSAMLYLFIFILLFVSLAVSVYIAELLDSFIYGFAITGGFYIVVALLVWAFRKPLFERPSIKRFMHLMYPKSLNHEE